LFLFYLSAFLSSARSVTFHLQKQFSAPGKAEYEQLKNEMLSDEVAKYFVELRNTVEKEGYPPLVVGQLVAYRNAQTGQKEWTFYASTTTLFEKSDGSTNFLPLESLIRHDWETKSISQPPVQIEYRWQFPDFPGGPKEVPAACRDFSERLWEFVFKFRALWEAEHDKEATWRKWCLDVKLFLPEE